MLDGSSLAADSDAYAKAAGTGDGLDELRRAMSRRSNSNTTSTEPTTENANAV